MSISGLKQPARNLARQIVRPSINPFDFENLNPHVVKAEHAVRGAIVQRANVIRRKMKNGVEFPFPDVVPCNIGNPFAVGKHELTYPRQFVAACECKELREKDFFPIEVRERAKEMIAETPGGLGAYSASQGIELVRKHIAQYITKRDGYKCDPDHVYLTTGASQAVEFVIKLLVSSPNVGIMMPYPTYSLYTAEIDMHNGQTVPYYLDESLNWDIHAAELERSYKNAVDHGIDVRALVVINPGNPTGHTIDKKTVQMMTSFAETHHLLIIADEVYQQNIYDTERPFVSFKSVVCQKKSNVQLISLNSISKGFMGECGHRGGYLELHNIHQNSLDQILKLSSLGLSPNSVGQILLDCMVRPPESDECKTTWQKETTDEIISLGKKSQKLGEALNKMPGIKCQPSNGAMYLFPRLFLPPAAIDAAHHKVVNNKPVKPDMFWAMKLLDETGIIVVPGSGFGQVEGTHHFRITFLPEAQIMDSVIERMSKFQEKFMDDYSH